MFHMKHLFYFILLHLIIAAPQINLYYTDWINESDNASQHDCLRIATGVKEASLNRQILSYCMSELPSTFKIENDDFFPKFTFDQLSQQNVTSQQLYLWSAPIDLIEHYQFYLNQLSTSNDSSLATEIFYNCTWPRFGPMCQYEMHYYHPTHSSLYQVFRDFYYTYRHTLPNLTCYTHLQCNRGPFPACLDWSEICNGNFDCLDGEFDEEHCWQLDMNKCKDNEYQCINGQCIPQSFYEDDKNVPDCLDGSDEFRLSPFIHQPCKTNEPIFGCEDLTCEQTSLTSSCVPQRIDFLTQAIFSVRDDSISEKCWSAFICLIDRNILSHKTCRKHCEDDDRCLDIINRECPDMLYIPAIPVLFGHIYFAYHKNDSRYLVQSHLWFPYVCYNNSRYDNYFIHASRVLFNNTMCYRHKDAPLPYGDIYWHEKYLAPFNRDLWKYHQIWKYNGTLNHISAKCNRSNMYQCANSLKCISEILLNGIQPDCPHGDDENIIEYNNIVEAEQLIGIYQGATAEVKVKIRSMRNHTSFQTICDGFIELLPQLINERNETDETDCEQWECNNIYTRCDGQWNCQNAVDEIGCNLSLSLNCSPDHHICVSPDRNQLMCLPVERTNDGKVDCLGATDEPTRCQTMYRSSPGNHFFYCMNETITTCLDPSKLCNDISECFSGRDDEQFCENRTFLLSYGVCFAGPLPFVSDVEKFFCNYTINTMKHTIKYFKLDEMIKSGEDPTYIMENQVPSSSTIIKISNQHQPRCYHGLDLRVWLNNKNNLTTDTCLCSPAFYGDRCQYQNQRIKLTIGFRVLSDSWQTLFAIIISLIDDSDQRIIHSYEQFSYLSMRDCKSKFNVYLLYSTRPKNSTKHHLIHIDIYDKADSLTYRGSVLYPITFPFLPVHRLAFIINIPRRDNNDQTCSDHQCVHGKCIRYLNNPQTDSFCQCDEGWSGRYCTIQHTCRCAPGSLCLGVSANNRSICVCPLHRFGPRCLLIDTTCQNVDNSTCLNRGQCIPNDDYMVSNQKFVCICPKGFIGDRCEITNNRFTLSFTKDIVLSQSMFIHFIEIINNSVPVRTTTFKTIPVRQDLVTVPWSQPFHLAFIELFNKTYYLTVVQKTYNPLTTIDKSINSFNRCLNINEIFNETIVQLHLLRRIKYYHLPCQNQSLNLSCFYDDVHLCICYDFGEKRLANCFEFNYSMTFNCLGPSLCENGVQCFQDDPNCPKRLMCVCPPCFYGIRCQFSTSGFGLSHDAILGYHILPHLSLIQQPFIIQISLTLTVIFIVAGFINGIFSLMTFKSKVVCEVGCGLYLLGSSITTLLIMTIFGLKFTIFLLAQMTIISNRSFLKVQCHSIDFLLRVCLCMDQWLNACVAMERAITVRKGTSFIKKKSKQAAKLVIIILLIVIVGTSSHDPIYRRLIDEENDDDDVKRTWCIISYPSGFEVYNYIIHIFHFFSPFLINLISAIMLITKKSHQQANLHKQRPYKEILREQFRQHKNILTAPIILIILALPRLIITFVSTCMKSADDAWLFLIGYFISFIPPMLTFIIFVLPSEFYRKEFRKSLSYYRTRIQRRLRLIWQR